MPSGAPASEAPESLSRLVADHLPELAWTARADGFIDHYNRRWYDYTGSTPDQMRGAGWERLHHPDWLGRVSERWTRSLQTGEPFEMEFPLKGKDGLYRWFLTRVSPMRDGEGRVVRWFGTNTEIDEQRRLRESTRFLAEASRLLSSSLDVEQTIEQVCKLAVPTFADWCAVDILDANGQAERLAVSHPDPAKVQLAYDLHQRFRPKPTDPTGFFNVLRTQQPEVTPEISDEMLVAALPDPDDLRLFRALQLRSSAMFPLIAHGRAIGTLTLVQAESGRRLTPQDLEVARELAVRAAVALENARLYRDAQHAAQRAEREKVAAETLARVGAAIASELERDKLTQRITDEATRTIGAAFGAFFHNVENEKGESYMLYTISGVPRDEFSKFPMPRNTAIFGPTFAGKGPVRYDDVTAQPQYGKNAPHRGMPAGHLPVKSYLAVPVKSRAGTVLGGLFFGHPEAGRFLPEHQTFVEGIASHAAIALDNTALLQRLRQSEEQLRALNAGLEFRVRERTAELQEANRELESFSYSVSHDLRAPMRHIAGFAQLLDRRASATLDEKGREYLRTIGEAAEQGGRLVDDLLEFSRMGRAELRQTRVSLRELVDEVRKAVEPELSGRSVEWRLGELPTVRGDPALLRQVLHNLISNAIKYSRTRAPAVIEIGTRRGPSEVEVFVRDNGVGFDMQYVDKLFGVFQRLHVPEQFEGTGIGLANVRRIIGRHGGRTWAEGELEKGATFHFTLPDEPAPPGGPGESR